MNAIGFVVPDLQGVPTSPPASGIDFILVRPGPTILDEMGCIKGDLDVPLSATGRGQVKELARQLRPAALTAVFSSPCTSAVQTAEAIAEAARLRVKIEEELRNLDHGLWQGKRIDELRQTQPRIYRLWDDRPETVSPPGGETIAHAERRASQFARRMLQRYRAAVIAIVVSEPFTTILKSQLSTVPASFCGLQDFWDAERRTSGWDIIHVDSVSRPR